MTTEASTLLASLDRTQTHGPAWLDAVRAAARDAVTKSGLPTKKTESFRFTPVRELAESSYVVARPIDTAEVERRVASRLGDDGMHRIVLVDGMPVLAGTAPAGVEIHPLRDLLARDPARLAPYLGKIALPAFFGAINAALFHDGIVIFVGKNARVATPIHLVHVAETNAKPTVAYPRVLVVAEQGSELSLVETVLGRDEGVHLGNEVSEVFVGPNAHVTHVSVHEARSHHVVRQAVRVDRDARYEARSITLGGGLLRVDLHVLLEGENAEIALDGVYHVSGHDHVDHHVLVEHRAQRCRSRQRYRGIVDDHGTGVFDGIVVVRPGASKTEAHQENKNLLLSTSGTVHTKPHLEIETDDVVCSHGATVGSLDADHLFYLRARGVSESMARAMLTYAFVREILEAIPHEALRARLDSAFLSRLPDGESLRGLA